MLSFRYGASSVITQCFQLAISIGHHQPALPTTFVGNVQAGGQSWVHGCPALVHVYVIYTDAILPL